MSCAGWSSWGSSCPTPTGVSRRGTCAGSGWSRASSAAGIPLDGLGAAIRSGTVSLDFLDAPAFERFSALSDVTFAQFAERTGVPVELLMLIREAAGSPAPHPDDLIRDEELPYAEFIAAQVEAGFSPAAIAAAAARPGRRPAPHGRDGVGLVEGRGDHAGRWRRASGRTRSSASTSAIG